MAPTHPYARGRGSTRRRWATTAGIGLVGGPLIAGWMLLPIASAAPSDKVAICHATNSVSNPYVVNQVDVSSVDSTGPQFLNGHGDHTGPVFDPSNPQDSWGDIIPPITNPETGTTFPGLNWPAGEAIWLNGCQVPSPTPTETSPTPTETSPTPTETSPTPTETSPTPTETSPNPTVTVTVTATATEVIVVPGPGVTTTVTASPTPTQTTPTPTETTVSPSPGTTTPTPTETSPTPTQTTVSPSPGTTSPTATTLSPSPGVTVTGSGLPTGVAAGGGPMQGIPGLSDPLRPPVLWAASAGLTAMGLLALARVRRITE